MKIYAVPSHKAFSIAARELARYYEAITGKKATILDLLPEEDAVCICPAGHVLSDERVKANSDEFSIVSRNTDPRPLLVITAGRGRSALYGVYAFLEKAAGCHYFWDGDVIPKAPSIPLSDFDLHEKPRFEYRAIRYFAHRGLHRFQAEHWSLEDWQREIDWMLKKRLNLFMLRIGTDDLFQRAFPDLVPYPANDKPLPESLRGYDNRTTFWSLEYRGLLRKKLLDYAFSRDLLHPEDCGTMTHWYSRTPLAFLETVKPTLMQQESKGYSEQTGLVWDIYDEKNLENYRRLTQTHVKDFGRPEIFHTIGLAERSLKGDREKGLAVKKHAYDTVTDFIKKTYPKAPILIAAWDFYFTYQPEEVRRMIGSFDPDTHIILDYTVDLKQSHNSFEQWDVVGKFPYIFGIFHGYMPQSHIHGDYQYLDEKLKLADSDPFCKGMAFWPELSHSDTFMLEYFTDNSWHPDCLPLEEKIARFCQKRYGENAPVMEEIWRAFRPLYALTEDQRYYMSSFFYPFASNRIVQRVMNRSNPAHERSLRSARQKVAEGKSLLSDMKKAVELLSKLPSELLENDFIGRDAVDLLRSITERWLDVEVLEAVLNWLDGKDSDSLPARREKCIRGMELFARVLALREEFSACHTLEQLKTVSPVNPHFEGALKDNLINGYCRSSVYESARFVFLPELKALFDGLETHSPEAPPNYTEQSARIFEEFFQTPLDQMKPQKEALSTVCRDLLQNM